MLDFGSENLQPNITTEKSGIIRKAVGGVRRLFSKPGNLSNQTRIESQKSKTVDANYQETLKAWHSADPVRADLPLMEKDVRKTANERARLMQEATLHSIKGTNTYERPMAEVSKKPQTPVEVPKAA